MNKYSKEPWNVGKTNDGNCCIWFDGKQEPDDEMGEFNTWIDCNTNENARRIAACVNACAGLDTELLENIVLTGETLKDRFEALKATVSI